MTKKKKEIIYYPFIGQKLSDEPFDLSKGDYSWTQQLKILADQNNIEIHTPDKATYKNVIGVIFFDNLFYHNLDDLIYLHNIGLLSKTIYIDYEPPTGHAKKHEPESIKELSKLFKYVVTYDDDLAGTDNFIKGNVANFYAKPPKKVVPFNERKMICMITNATTNDVIIHVLNSWNYTHLYNSSNIKYHPKASYHRRQEIAEYFLNKHPDKIDLYGSQWPDKFTKIHKGSINRDVKIDILSQYKFAITLDSYINQRGYISEKIFDAFNANTVPIYLGASNVADYIPKNCYVDIKDFNNFDALYNYLEKMTQDEYNDRLLAINKFLKSDEYNNQFSSSAIARALFSAINAKPKELYNVDIAEKILSQLAIEKDALSPKKIGIIRIDKQHKDGLLYYVATLRGTTSDQVTIHDKVYKMARGKLSEVQTYLSSTLEKGVDEVTFDIPYNDIINEGPASYYLKSPNSKPVKINFFITDLINNTVVGKNRILFAKGNTVKVKNNRWYNKYYEAFKKSIDNYK
jgi:hypothetical protein